MAALVAVVALGAFLILRDGQPGRTVMDDFESGALTGWQTVGSGNGGWVVYGDGRKAPDPSRSDPNVPFLFPDPPQGRFAASTDPNGPGTRILYRDVRLSGRLAVLMNVFYAGSAPFTSPRTLAWDGPVANQQFRVDLLDPFAPIDSVAGDDVLVNVFRTSPGDEVAQRPTPVRVDVSRWAGKVVRLRVVATDNRGPLRVGVDNIRFEPIDAGGDGRIELPETPKPSSAINLVLHRLSEADALAALSARPRSSHVQISSPVPCSSPGTGTSCSRRRGVSRTERPAPPTRPRRSSASAR